MPKWFIPDDAEVDLSLSGQGEGAEGESFCGGVVSIEYEDDVVELRTETSTITYEPGIVTEVTVRWLL